MIVLQGGSGRLGLVDLGRGPAHPGSYFDRLHAPVHTFHATGECTWHPFTDVMETPDSFVVRMELAGMDPRRLEVAVDGHCLIVRGWRDDPWRGTGATRHQIEIPHGAFERVVAMPMQFAERQVRAEYGSTGFLEITVDKE